MIASRVSIARVLTSAFLLMAAGFVLSGMVAGHLSWWLALPWVPITFFNVAILISSLEYEYFRGRMDELKSIIRPTPWWPND